MSFTAPGNGNNPDKDTNNSPANSLSMSDSNNRLHQEKGKEQFTMGGVKKPKFRPVVNKAVSVHKIDRTAIPLVSTSPTPIVVKQEPIEIKQEPTTENKNHEDKSVIPKEEKKPKEKQRKSEANKDSKQPRPNRAQPRFLVSGESKFFATNNAKNSSNAIDTALLSSRLSKQKGIKEEMEVEDEFNDDHELTAENNGPIRFPYLPEIQQPTQTNASWDEDDAQVTPFELLQGVKDGELMLFALPSFLPIYKKNREYGIQEDEYTHILDTKPHDYVQNELMDVEPGKIGKMRVHESGRITMDINGYIVDMNVSIPLHYQQQVATVDEQNLNILGNVTQRLILTPELQNFK